MLEHGGDLIRASREYGIPVERWVDLSTGINPCGYPVPQVPPLQWLRLPSDLGALTSAAGDYYGSETLLPVAGTQAAIGMLPRMRLRSRVMVAQLTYNEHAHAWRRHQHEVRAVPMGEFEKRLRETDVVIVCNPNNPTGERIEPERLLEWHAQLATRGGWLIVDEAYIDATPEMSLARLADRPGLVVLRSLGKFFGLAGARVGFVFAERTLLDAMQNELGPWTVSGPAQFAACAALRDRAWQARTRSDLMESIQRLGALLARAGIIAQGTALFLWWRDERAHELHRALARKAIITRLFSDARPNSVRFGLPDKEDEWKTLERALVLWKDMQCT